VDVTECKAFVWLLVESYYCAAHKASLTIIVLALC